MMGIWVSLGIYFMLGALFWVVTLAMPLVREVWAKGRGTEDPRVMVMSFFVACFFWPIRLVMLVRMVWFRVYDSTKVAVIEHKGKKALGVVEEDLREEEAFLAQYPNAPNAEERRKKLVRMKTITAKIGAMMDGFCPDCGKLLDFGKRTDAAWCHACNRAFGRDYDPRNEVE